MATESIDKPKRWTRRLRFRLSTLFLLILIICSGLAWFHWKTKTAREQRLAVEEIHRAGGWVVYDYERNSELTYDPLGPVWLETFLGHRFFACVVEARIAGDVDLGSVRRLPRLDDLQVFRDRLPPADAGHLKDLTGLHRLAIHVTDATDEDLQEIGRLSVLNDLTIGWTLTLDGYVLSNTRTEVRPVFPNTQITDVGLAHLGQLGQLQHLRLRNSKISDAGLGHLRGLANLESLDLSETQVTDAGLAHLKPLTRLRQLFLARTQVTDAGLAHLRDRPGLDHLELNETRITDDGVDHLLAMPDLSGLYLNHTRVTDVGVARLPDLPNLRHLGLSGTRVTDVGLSCIGKTEKLQVLSVVRTEITSAGLAHLNNLAHLSVIELGGPNVTDDWLQQVSQLQQLHHLWLYDARVTDDGLLELESLVGLSFLLLLGDSTVTDQGIKRLKAEMPLLTVSRSFPIVVDE